MRSLCVSWPRLSGSGHALVAFWPSEYCPLAGKGRSRAPRSRLQLAQGGACMRQGNAVHHSSPGSNQSASGSPVNSSASPYGQSSFSIPDSASDSSLSRATLCSNSCIPARIALQLCRVPSAGQTRALGGLSCLEKTARLAAASRSAVRQRSFASQFRRSSSLKASATRLQKT
jgi:hypothetical protein